jgi:hypothetical protein
VGHLNGDESDGEPANLVWNCRSCNTRLGVVFKRLGLGRRTRQYNPVAEGAKSLGQWLTAVTSMKGENSAMSVADAVAMIRATPLERRSQFAEEIWQKRRAHYGPTGRSDSVPF